MWATDRVRTEHRIGWSWVVARLLCARWDTGKRWVGVRTVAR